MPNITVTFLVQKTDLLIALLTFCIMDKLVFLLLVFKFCLLKKILSSFFFNYPNINQKEYNLSDIFRAN